MSPTDDDLVPDEQEKHARREVAGANLEERVEEPLARLRAVEDLLDLVWAQHGRSCPGSRLDVPHRRGSSPFARQRVNALSSPNVDIDGPTGCPRALGGLDRACYPRARSWPASATRQC